METTAATATVIDQNNWLQGEREKTEMYLFLSMIVFSVVIIDDGVVL